MNKRFNLTVIAAVTTLLAGLAPRTLAATATWTNTASNASGFWTNNLNWNAATYPDTVAGENAFMTNSVAGAYTNILNTSLTIGTLGLSNVQGQAWLTVANATLTATALNLNRGGVLQINSGGLVTNVALTWGGPNAAFSANTNGIIVLNAGGSLYTTNNIGIPNADNNVLVQGTGGIWNLNNQALTVGGTAANAPRNTMILDGGGMYDGVVVTNVGAFNIGVAQGASNATVIIKNGAHLQANGTLTLGSVSRDNSIIVTNGGRLTTTNIAWIGFANSSTGNTVKIVGGGAMPSVWNVSSNAIGFGGVAGHSNPYQSLIIDGMGVVGGAVITNARLSGNGATFGSQILITNGGKFLMASTATAALSGSSNIHRVGGGGATALWDFGNGDVVVAGHSNIWIVGASGVVSNLNATLGATIGGINTISNALYVVNGGKFVAGRMVIGQGNGAVPSTSSNNYVLVDNSRLEIGTGGLVLGLNNGSHNRLVITNGAQLVTASATTTSGGASNTIILVGGGASASTWNAGSNNITLGNFSTLRIDGMGVVGGAVLTNAVIAPGLAGTQIVITNGGRLINGAAAAIAVNGVGGRVTVGGGGATATWDFNYGSINFGNTTGQNSNTWVVGASGVVTNLNTASGATIGSINSASNALYVVNGGQFWTGKMTIGQGNGAAISTSSNNFVLVDNALLDIGTGGLTFGLNNGIQNGLVVTNGGQFATAGATSLSGGVSNYVHVAGNGASPSVWNAKGTTVTLGSFSVVNVDGMGVVGGAKLTNGVLAVGGTRPLVVITNGGQVVNGLNAAVNVSSVGGRISVGGGGATATWNFNGGSISLGSSTAQNSNVWTVGAGGVVTNLDAVNGATIGAINAVSNALYITDGGKFFTGKMSVGAANGSTVTASNNVVFVDNSLLDIGSGGLTIGINLAADNSVIVTNRATVNIGSAGLTFGSGRTNRVLVVDNSVLQANSIVIPAGANFNTVSNRNSTYRFTTGNPTVTVGGGIIAINNGTIAYRDASGVSIAHAGVNSMTFSGDNRFRLENSSTAGSGQNFTFNTGQRYRHLEMVNGITAYNGNITVGLNGTMLASNTTATVNGIMTNNGVFRSFNSQVTFNGPVINNGGWITDPTTNIFLNDLIVTSSGSISMSAGDVMVFKSNFLNRSTQGGTYDTLSGKFQFDGDGLSTLQTFETAGQDLGPGPLPSQPTSQLGSPAFPVYANNFALGTLELTNATILTIADAFPLDSQRGALYLENLFIQAGSFLIISNNVSVYFFNSNSWDSSYYTLLDGAELHQLIPEPSLLLLLATGATVLVRARKWRRSRV